LVTNSTSQLRSPTRGEILSSGGSRQCETSGLQVWVGGDDETELKIQIAEALAFLQKDGDEVRRLRHLEGVQTARLRFGEEGQQI